MPLDWTSYVSIKKEIYPSDVIRDTTYPHKRPVTWVWVGFCLISANFEERVHFPQDFTTVMLMWLHSRILWNKWEILLYI